MLSIGSVNNHHLLLNVPLQRRYLLSARQLNATYFCLLNICSDASRWMFRCMQFRYNYAKP